MTAVRLSTAGILSEKRLVGRVCECPVSGQDKDGVAGAAAASGGPGVLIASWVVTGTGTWPLRWNRQQREVYSAVPLGESEDAWTQAGRVCSPCSQ